MGDCQSTFFVRGRGGSPAGKTVRAMTTTTTTTPSAPVSDAEIEAAWETYNELGKTVGRHKAMIGALSAAAKVRAEAQPAAAKLALLRQEANAEIAALNAITLSEAHDAPPQHYGAGAQYTGSTFSVDGDEIRTFASAAAPDLAADNARLRARLAESETAVTEWREARLAITRLKILAPKDGPVPQENIAAWTRLGMAEAALAQLEAKPWG
jgi:hypothetical protein